MAKTTPKAKNSGFMQPMQPSEHLAKIVGTEPLPRSEVTKKIWAHIKKHNLQNPKNKREILADDKLQPIFGSKKLDMFQFNVVNRLGWVYDHSRFSIKKEIPAWSPPISEGSCCHIRIVD